MRQRIRKTILRTIIIILIAGMFGLTLNIQATAKIANLAPTGLINSLVLEFDFLPPIVTEGSICDSVSMSGLPQYGAPGEPVLPFKVVKALIPQCKNVQSVDVTARNKIVLEGRFDVEYGKTPIPISSNATVEDCPNQEIYSSSNPFPGVLFSQPLEQRLRGYNILMLKLHPVQYLPKTGKLYYFENMTVTISLKETGKISSLFGNLLQDRALVSSIVDNPNDVKTYTNTATHMQLTSLVDPSYSYNYVIITNNALESSFQPLVDWKIQKGLNATIVLVEDVMNEPEYHCDGLFGDGCGTAKFNDTQAHIRNFIKDAYQNWGTKYVLLGGDDEIIPSRGVYVYAGDYTDYNIPCDMYYGALDGSWDNDNDTIFGEPVHYWSGPENGTSGEEADFFAEVYIGRATIDTAKEATDFVNKTLTYEQNLDLGYLKKALVIGQTLDDLTKGGNGKDLATDIIPQYTTTRLYDRDGTFSRTAVIDEMNSGTHIVNHDGHAWYTSVMGLSRSDVDNLTNDKYFIAYSLGCYSAAFDEETSGGNEAIAEHFILSPHGAFAYIGNSRYGWYYPGSTDGPGDRYDRSFFHVLREGIKNLGKALQLSKENLFDEYIHRWTYFTLNLLGDPEVEIVTNITAPTAHFETRTDLLTPPSIGGVVNLRGTAKRGTTPDATFSNFTIEFGQGTTPIFWITTGIDLINNGESEVINGTLATWNTGHVTAGFYTLKLTAFNANGLIGEDRWIVIVHRLSTILVVNDDDGSSWIDGTSLPEFESALTAVGCSYFVWNESSMGNPPLDLLANFELVIWTCGDYYNEAVDQIDAATLESYFAQGGNIIVEGEDVGYDHGADSFMTNVAHAIMQVDGTGAPGLTVTSPTHPVTQGLPANFTWLTDPPFDDGVATTNDGFETIRYTDTSWTAVTAFDGTGTTNGSVVYFAFPIYCLTQSERDTLVINSVNWLLPTCHTQVAFFPENYNFTVGEIGVGHRFNATIEVRNVTELFAWQIKVYFNNTVLNCSNAYYHPDDPISSGSHIPVTPFINNAFNATHGYVQHGVSVMGTNSYSGNFSVCVIEFEVIEPPPENGYVKSTLSLNNTSTYLLWIDASTEIPCIKINGWYGYYPDITPLTITLLSPENKTYSTNSLPLTFTISEIASWMGYSLDGYANVTIGGNVTLCGLWEGTHWIVVYANDTSGNMGVSEKIYFKMVYPDIAVTNVTPSKTVVGQGYCVNITVIVENQGDFTETFNVTAYYNDTAVILPDGKNYTTVTLSSGNSTSISFLWNTTGVAKGNYTISVYATLLPGETDTTDNNCTDGTILVTIAGDVNGDCLVDMKDIAPIAAIYGAEKTDPEYVANCDLNGDGIIDMKDIASAAAHYGETW